MKNIEIKKDIIVNKNGKDMILVHISDIHFNINTNAKVLNNIVDYIYELKPDYICISGDLLDSKTIINNNLKIKELLSFLSRLSKIAKLFISLGNHDTGIYYDMDFFRKMNEIKDIYILDNTKYEDDNIYIAGYTLSSEYYYNLSGYESGEILLRHFDKNKNITAGLPKNKFKVALIHSPICLNEEDVINKLKEYNLILCGHMHNGMVPRILDKIIKNNHGLISPDKHLFINNARGKIVNKYYTIIINGGITKLSLHSSKIISKLNFIYPSSINKIEIKGEEKK